MKPSKPTDSQEIMGNHELADIHQARDLQEPGDIQEVGGIHQVGAIQKLPAIQEARGIQEPRRIHEPADIIVLGRRLEAGGAISEIFRHRLEKALTVYREKRRQELEARLVVTGGDLGHLGISEARAGFLYLLRQRGVPEGDLAVEEKALDTIGNAVYTKVLLLESGCKAPIVVSSCYHIPRTSYIFSHVLGPDFEPTYVSAPTGLSGPDYHRHWHSESMKMIEAVRFLDGLDAWPGDHEKIHAFLREKGLVVEDGVV